MLYLLTTNFVYFLEDKKKYVNNMNSFKTNLQKVFQQNFISVGKRIIVQTF